MSDRLEASHPLFGCQLKVDRAQEHYETLQDAWNTFMGRNPYTVVNEFEPEFGHYVARLKIGERPPPEFSPIIGDIVHNGRSAPDHLAWQLVRKNRRKPSSNTAFPIFTKSPFDSSIYPSVKEAEDALNRWKRQTKGMRSDDVALLKRLQPYNGTESPDDHPLTRLHQLSNWDKHRELHFATQGVQGMGVHIRATNATVNILYFLPQREILEDDAIIARYEVIRRKGKAHVNVHANVFFDVAFGEGSPLEGLGVKETLFEIGRYVSDIFARFIIRFDKHI